MVKSWEASEFQATLAGQHSKDYELVAKHYIAALGTRGDYILIKIPCTAAAETTAGAVTVVGKAYLEIMDILGVPETVQLGKKHGYAKHSPFDSADLAVSDEMKVGIEAERLSVLLNKAVTTNTWVSQLIAGEEDARIQAKWAEAMPATACVDNVLWIRLKPTQSNVFMVRYDSAIWMLPSGDFFEKLDT